MSNLIDRGVRAYRRHGWRNLPFLLAYNVWFIAKTRVPPRLRMRLRKPSFDDRHGTDTGGVLPVSDFEVAAERVLGANYYEGVSEELFGKIIKALGGGDPRATFIDFGSGKGRQLLLASEYPFRRVLGVELEPNLHRVALRNIEIYRTDTQKCRDVASIRADATELELPPDPLVCSFYNPFDQRILRNVVTNIERSLREKPREAQVIYLNPVHREVFDESPGWQLNGVSIFSGYVLYRWTGASP